MAGDNKSFNRQSRRVSPILQTVANRGDSLLMSDGADTMKRMKALVNRKWDLQVSTDDVPFVIRENDEVNSALDAFRDVMSAEPVAGRAIFFERFGRAFRTPGDARTFYQQLRSMPDDFANRFSQNSLHFRDLTGSQLSDMPAFDQRCMQLFGVLDAYGYASVQDAAQIVDRAASISDKPDVTLNGLQSLRYTVASDKESDNGAIAAMTELVADDYLHRNRTSDDIWTKTALYGSDVWLGTKDTSARMREFERVRDIEAAVSPFVVKVGRNDSQYADQLRDAEALFFDRYGSQFDSRESADSFVSDYLNDVNQNWRYRSYNYRQMAVPVANDAETQRVADTFGFAFSFDNFEKFDELFHVSEAYGYSNLSEVSVLQQAARALTKSKIELDVDDDTATVPYSLDWIADATELNNRTLHRQPLSDYVPPEDCRLFASLQNVDASKRQSLRPDAEDLRAVSLLTGHPFVAERAEDAIHAYNFKRQANESAQNSQSFEDLHDILAQRDAAEIEQRRQAFHDAELDIHKFVHDAEFREAVLKRQTETVDVSEQEMHGGGEAPPLHGDSEAPPLHGDSEAPPLHGDSEAPPLHGDSEAPPLHGDGDAPPLHGDGDASPLHGDGDAPPLHGDGDAPPLHGDGDAPPLHGDGDAPPLHGDGDAPPLHGDGDAPPLHGDGDAPPLHGDGGVPYDPVLAEFGPPPPEQPQYGEDDYSVLNDDAGFGGSTEELESNGSVDSYSSEFSDGRPVPDESEAPLVPDNQEEYDYAALNDMTDRANASLSDNGFGGADFTNSFGYMSPELSGMGFLMSDEGVIDDGLAQRMHADNKKATKEYKASLSREDSEVLLEESVGDVSELTDEQVPDESEPGEPSSGSDNPGGPDNPDNPDGPDGPDNPDEPGDDEPSAEEEAQAEQESAEAPESSVDSSEVEFKETVLDAASVQTDEEHVQRRMRAAEVARQEAYDARFNRAFDEYMHRRGDSAEPQPRRPQRSGKTLGDKAAEAAETAGKKIFGEEGYAERKAESTERQTQSRQRHLNAEQERFRQKYERRKIKQVVTGPFDPRKKEEALLEGSKTQSEYLDELMGRITDAQYDFVTYSKAMDRWANPSDLQMQIDRRTKGYYHNMIDACMRPLSNGVSAGNIVETIGIYAGMCIVSKPFRDYSKASMTKAMWPAIEKMTKTTDAIRDAFPKSQQRVCNWVERTTGLKVPFVSDRIEMHEFRSDTTDVRLQFKKEAMLRTLNNGRVPLTPETTALHYVSFSNQYYNTLRDMPCPVPPTKPKEPTGKAPVEPTPPTKPTKPTKPTEPRMPTLGRAPEKPRAPKKPVEPQKPVEPVIPKKPASKEQLRTWMKNEPDKKKRDSYQKNIDTYDARMDKYQADLAAYPTKKAAYDKAMLEYPQKLAEYQQAAADYPGEQARYEKLREAYEKASAAYDGKVDSYSEQLTEHEAAMEAYHSAMDEYNAAMETYEAECEAYDAKYEAYEAQYKTYTQQKVEYNKQKHEFEKQDAAYKVQMQDYNKQKEAYDRRCKALKSKYDASTKVLFKMADMDGVDKMDAATNIRTLVGSLTTLHPELRAVFEETAGFGVAKGKGVEKTYRDGTKGRVWNGEYYMVDEQGNITEEQFTGMFKVRTPANAGKMKNTISTYMTSLMRDIDDVNVVARMADSDLADEVRDHFQQMVRDDCRNPSVQNSYDVLRTQCARVRYEMDVYMTTGKMPDLKGEKNAALAETTSIVDDKARAAKINEINELFEQKAAVENASINAIKDTISSEQAAWEMGVYDAATSWFAEHRGAAVDLAMRNMVFSRGAPDEGQRAAQVSTDGSVTEYNSPTIAAMIREANRQDVQESQGTPPIDTIDLSADMQPAAPKVPKQPKQAPRRPSSRQSGAAGPKKLSGSTHDVSDLEAFGPPCDDFDPNYLGP